MLQLELNLKWTQSQNLSLQMYKCTYLLSKRTVFWVLLWKNVYVLFITSTSTSTKRWLRLCMSMGKTLSEEVCDQLRMCTNFLLKLRLWNLSMLSEHPVLHFVSVCVNLLVCLCSVRNKVLAHTCQHNRRAGCFLLLVTSLNTAFM